MKTDYKVDVFFYGSYINFDVLAEAGIEEREHEPVRLPGYRLVIEPFANLEADDASQAYGILTKLSHDELYRLYQEHAREKLGVAYHPEAVLVFNIDNALMPALCYRAHEMEPATPEPDYVDRILHPARDYGFPADYIEDIESFKSR